MANTAHISPDGTGILTIEGQPPAYVAPGNVDEARQILLDLAIDHCKITGTTIELVAVDPASEHLLKISGDGSVHAIDYDRSDGKPPADQAPVEEKPVEEKPADTSSSQMDPPQDSPQATPHASPHAAMPTQDSRQTLGRPEQSQRKQPSIQRFDAAPQPAPKQVSPSPDEVRPAPTPNAVPAQGSLPASSPASRSSRGSHVAPDSPTSSPTRPTPPPIDNHPTQFSTTPSPEAFGEPFTELLPKERSFLADSQLTTPPPNRWRSFLAWLGIKVEASAEEVSEWNDERAISQHWAGPRTIAILNGKGGAGKTPATVLLSALFARAGGSGVLAWDNNVTRGTLGWRTESGTHEATVLDLLPQTEQLLTPDARAADLAAVVHHQTIDKYDVLRSNPLLLSTIQKLTPDQLDAVHAVAAKYYRLIFMDSGNDEGDELWLRMIDHADQIVIATTTRADHAEAGRLLLKALYERDKHSAQLASQAVVIVSQADREEADAASIAQGFKAIARDVVTVPYDPAMRQQWLRVDNLAPATRRAYLRAAAAIASEL